VRRKVSTLYDLVLQILGGARIIRVYQGEEAETRNLVDRSRSYFDELMVMVRARALSQVVLESLAGLGLVVAIIVGGFEVMGGTLGWPSLLAFLMAARALQGPLHNLNANYVEIQRNSASLRRIVDLLEESPEIRDSPGAIALDSPPALIELENLTFGYGARLVLEGISVAARAGDTVAIVGASGAGKSTLLNLVARFYDPATGAVRFDGIDLRHYRLADVYGRIAMVTQEPFLFATSVRENIRYGRPDASQAEIEDAARAADVHEDILALPDGYDTRVGAGGRSLSRGEEQRVNIARAILKDAPVLLLDEPTSSLDAVSQVRVQGALERLARGRTTFVVAHRLSSIRQATKILVLERGRLAGKGTHEELLRDCRLYRAMWREHAHLDDASGRDDRPRAEDVEIAESLLEAKDR
jgi:ABC-type multidrug transport system fused ATPase/permease subunit